LYKEKPHLNPGREKAGTGVGRIFEVAGAVGLLRQLRADLAACLAAIAQSGHHHRHVSDGTERRGLGDPRHHVDLVAEFLIHAAKPLHLERWRFAKMMGHTPQPKSLRAAAPAYETDLAQPLTHAEAAGEIAMDPSAAASMSCRGRMRGHLSEEP
jgi:hypothetical protein